MITAEPTTVILLEVRCDGFGHFLSNFCDVAWVLEDTIFGRTFTFLAREVGADRLGLTGGKTLADGMFLLA